MDRVRRTLVKNGVECNINKHALKSIRRAGIHEPKLIRQNKTSSYGLNHGWLWFILDFVWRLDVQLREFSSYIRNILRGGGGNGTWHRGNTDAADGGHSTNIGEETQDKAKKMN